MVNYKNIYIWIIIILVVIWIQAFFIYNLLGYDGFNGKEFIITQYDGNETIVRVRANSFINAYAGNGVLIIREGTNLKRGFNSSEWKTVITKLIKFKTREELYNWINSPQ